MGCIQARLCNSNGCPVGIATQNPSLTAGLVVKTKSARVARYHDETIDAALELIGAAGISTPEDLRPWHILRRVSAHDVRHYGEIYDFISPGDLLADDLPPDFRRAWQAATPHSFHHANDTPLSP